MNTITKDNIHKEIFFATAVFGDGLEIQVLQTKAGSHCHFFEKFEISEYFIQLRLDWADTNASGHPCLDADFYCKSTRKIIKNLRGTLREAHHTQANSNEGRNYEWCFEEAKVAFSVSIHWLGSGVCKCTATLHSNPVVIRANKRPEVQS